MLSVASDKGDGSAFIRCWCRMRELCKSGYALFFSLNWFVLRSAFIPVKRIEWFDHADPAEPSRFFLFKDHKYSLMPNRKKVNITKINKRPKKIYKGSTIASYSVWTGGLA